MKKNKIKFNLGKLSDKASDEMMSLLIGELHNQVEVLRYHYDEITDEPMDSFKTQDKINDLIKSVIKLSIQKDENENGPREGLNYKDLKAKYKEMPNESSKQELEKE